MLRLTHARTCFLPARAVSAPARCSQCPSPPTSLSRVSKGSSSAETSATPSVSPVTGTLSSVMVSPRRLSDHPAKDLLGAQDVLVPKPVMSSGFPLPSPALDGASPPGCFLGPLPPVFAGTVISRPRARSDFCLFTTVFLPLVPGFPMTCCCLLPGVACRTRMHYPVSLL